MDGVRIWFWANSGGSSSDAGEAVSSFVQTTSTCFMRRSEEKMTGKSPRNWSENIARMSLLLSPRAALWPLAFALLACAGTVKAESLAVSPPLEIFAPVRISQTGGPRTVTVKNYDLGQMALISIAAGDDFAQTNDCPAVLVRRAECHVSVTFTPTRIGLRLGLLSVALREGRGTDRFYVIWLGLACRRLPPRRPQHLPRLRPQHLPQHPPRLRRRPLPQHPHFRCRESPFRDRCS